MKKLKLFFTALLLLCCITATAHDFEVEGIYYTITDATNKTLAVTYKGSSYSAYSNEYIGSVIIPESVTYSSSTYSVTSIGSNAFMNCDGLTSVVIPNSVTTIGSSAFNGCTSLKELRIENGEGTLSLGYNTYNSYNGGKGLFYDCPLETLYLGRDLSYNTYYNYGYSPFYNKTTLTSVTIGNSVTSIGNDAFEGCTGLKTIYNFSNITFSKGSSDNGYIAYYADKVYNAPYGSIEGDFIWCNLNGANTLVCYLGEVAELTLPADYNGENYVIGNEAFKGCNGLTSITIPNSVTSIGSYAFYGCSGLTSIVIPNSVTSIGSYAFYGCKGLTSVTIPNSVTSILGATFSGCTGLTSITIPNSVTSIGNDAFYNCTGLTSVTIPNSVTSIGSSAFYECTSLKDLRIEDGIETLNLGYNGSYEGLFYDCPLETLYLGRDLSYNTYYDYGYSPFYNIKTLASVTIGNSVTSIGGSAFRNCPSLTSITIPNSVTSIGSNAFYNCTGLTSVVIPNSVTSIGSDAFSYCTGLTSVVIGNSVTSIGSSAFYGCTGLKSVVNLSNLTFSNGSYDNGYIAYNADKVINIPNGLIDGDIVWAENEDGMTLAGYLGNTTELTLPTEYNSKSITSIGDYAFSYCSGLISVEIPNSVTSIGYSAFRGCTGLTSIEIPNSVTSIGESAFYNCTGLTSVVIPNGVTSIGNYAFNGCTSLKELRIEDGEGTLSLGCNTYYGYSAGKGLFYDCPLETLYLGRNLSYNTGSYYGYSPFYKKTKLTSVTIGNSVTSIGNSAFEGCSGLTSVEIPNSVTSIGSDAFYGCSGLKKTIWFTNTPPSGYGNINATYNYVANNQYSGLNNIKVYPYLSSMFEVDGVKYVPVSPAERTCDAIDCAYNNTIAVDVVIGKTVSFKGVAMNVKEIMPYALYANKKIKSVKVENEGNIGNYAFSGCTALTTANISNEGNIGNYAFSGCTALTTATISNKGNIGDNAFENSFKAYSSEVKLDNKGGIGNYAFSGCNHLVEATLGDSVTLIDASAFYGCSMLRNIDIPDNVATLGYEAFYNCSSLKSAKIGAGVTAINEATFSGCSSMTSITIGENVKTIGKNAFNGCSLLSEITIPQSVTKIENYAFDNCSSLADVIIEDKTISLSLGSNGSSPLFSDCPLDSVYIGCKITYNTSSSYGYSPFYRNTSLRTVVITDTETEIYNNEFYGCSNLKDVSIGNGVNKIGKWAFSGCSGLDYFAFGKNVRSIGEEAFSDCNNVSQIISRAKIAPACGTQALDDINKWSCTLLVPENYKSEYQAAEQWKEFFFIEGIAAEMYTVTFVVDGEIYDTVSVEYGEVIALPETPTKEGHTFSGWSEMPETMPAEDITVTGSFSVNSYNVTFVVDEEVYKTVSVNYGETIPMPEEPVKDGCTFSGWSEIPATMPAEDITITGSFYANYYTLTYMVDGEVYATVTVGYNSVIPEMEEPTKEGHTFSGWENVPETMPAQDITIIGSFTVNSYNAIFLVDNALYAMLSVNYGEAIELPEPPNKEGFVFDGWEGLPVTMPAKDIVLIAIFTDVTGVDDVKSEIGKVKAIYDFQGRKVDTTNKGIYIINGKKVFVK